jgi:hypothetical protein
MFAAVCDNNGVRHRIEGGATIFVALAFQKRKVRNFSRHFFLPRSGCAAGAVANRQMTGGQDIRCQIAWAAIAAVIFGSHLANPEKTAHPARMPRKWAFAPDGKAGMCPKAVNSSQSRIPSRAPAVAHGPSGIAERSDNTLN